MGRGCLGRPPGGRQAARLLTSRLPWTLPLIALLLSACAGTGPEVAHAFTSPATARHSPSPGPAAAPSASATTPRNSPAPARPAAGHTPGPSTGTSSRPPRVSRAADGGPGRFPATASGVLDGQVVLVDPGHNGGNAGAPSIINRLIWNGRESETCDTTGTETDGGYTEAQFNWNVARYLTADLRAEGATVVLTRTSNTGVGPCVTRRAAIGNHAHADAGVSIHADGGPADGRGFAILEPVADGVNNAIVGPSAVLGADLRSAFAAGTHEPVSSYDGVNGIQPRDDLGGINLSTVPKVFIECANMRNATDAARVTSPAWQARAARAIARGLTTFLRAR
jgi:N-acetylmuramoyl-L-alanine amidase